MPIPSADPLSSIRAELARVTEERNRYRNLLQWVVKRAEFYYHHGRKSLDNLPGWIHGDDGPVYGFLKIAQRIETALTTPEPPASPRTAACPGCGIHTRVDSDHCQHCGALLSDDFGTPAASPSSEGGVTGQESAE